MICRGGGFWRQNVLSPICLSGEKIIHRSDRTLDRLGNTRHGLFPLSLPKWPQYKKQDHKNRTQSAFIFFNSLFYGIKNVLCAASSVQLIGRPVDHGADPTRALCHSPLFSPEVYHIFFCGRHSVSVVALFSSFFIGTVYRRTRDVKGCVSKNVWFVLVTHQH